MNRTGFKGKFERTRPARDGLSPRAAASMLAGLYRVPAPSIAKHVETPKFVYVDDKPYRQLVATMACYRCGIEGFSNACHSDNSADGKGKGIKACDLTCWPGCVDRPGVLGCHSLVGMKATMPREAREVFEREAAQATRDELAARAQHDRRILEILLRVGIPTC